MGFSRQEYWSELLCPPPGNLSDPGIELKFSYFFLHWQANCLQLAPPGKPIDLLITTVSFLPNPWPTGQLINLYQETSLVVLQLRLQAPNAGALGSIPGLGARSHMLQPRVHMPQLKIPHAATKTWCSQIKKYLKNKWINKPLPRDKYRFSSPGITCLMNCQWNWPLEVALGEGIFLQ